MSAPNRSLYRIGWRVHKLLWRLTGGRVGGRSVGMPVLELTTTGRKSSEPRSVLLTYVDHPQGWVVIASNLGSHRHPAWWLNLSTSPDATVKVRAQTDRVTASELQGEERAEYWARAVAANAGYAEYQTLTDRPIPVVLLKR